jgi:hypothetical protein
MATAISVTCPGCKKSMRAPGEARGKKVRCKTCSHVFVIPVSAGQQAGSRAPAGKPGARPQSEADRIASLLPPEEVDEDGDGKPYGVSTLDLTPRCPHCANELDDGAIICLHCGYNTQTREFHRTRRVADTTGGDIFLWLLPGIVCFILCLALIGFDIWYCVKIKDMVKGQEWMEWLGSGPIRLWVVIISLFAIYYAGKFSIRRLILHPTPPEVEV